MNKLVTLCLGIILLVVVSACAILYRSYPVMMQIVGGNSSNWVTQSFLDSEPKWFLTREQSVTTFTITLSKTPTSSAAIDQMNFKIRFDSGRYSVLSQPPSTVKLGDKVTFFLEDHPFNKPHLYHNSFTLSVVSEDGSIKEFFPVTVVDRYTR
jgi:hypothetical protein